MAKKSEKDLAEKPEGVENDEVGAEDTDGGVGDNGGLGDVDADPGDDAGAEDASSESAEKSAEYPDEIRALAKSMLENGINHSKLRTFDGYGWQGWTSGPKLREFLKTVAGE